MSWPALLNHYPLLYADSLTYVEDGVPVARAVFLHQLSDYYGMRSFIYSLVILPFHWDKNPWPVVALQALITAYVIWLVVRSILLRKTVSRYLILIAVLSLLTSVSWFSSLVMPDILGPVLYLCVYLLLFARENLSRAERVVVGLITWWAVTSHATHLMLATGLCILLALAVVLWRRRTRGIWKGIAEVAVIILLAAGAQVALNTYLYGKPSLNGDRPPFLMARVIADGPGRWYLEKHCPQANLAVCKFVHSLNNDSDDFIWGANGVWENADDTEKSQMLQEEVPFVLATLREFPRAQLSKSAYNFKQQLISIGLYDLDADDYVREDFDHAFPGKVSHYLESRQARRLLPLAYFSNIHYRTVVASLVVIGVFIVLAWRLKHARLAGLSMVIVSMVVTNAFVTGAISTVEDRYESRVIWLLPLLAGLLAMEWLEHRRAGKSRGARIEIKEG